MSAESKLSFGALGRLATAAVASYAGVKLTGHSDLGVALATVATAYLTNRSNIIEEQSEQQVHVSGNHQLQLALAGAFRIALEELRPLHPVHGSLFDSWQAMLDAALDQPTTLLPAIIPAQLDPLLEAANAHTDPAAAFEEAESLLRFWLAYRQAFERLNSYPCILPPTFPELPADLHHSFQYQLLPEFQKAFTNLLVSNDAAYARRAFERRQLQEVVGTSRKHTEILERLDAQGLLPLAPLRPPEPLDEKRELEILRAENRAIPVVGREGDLASLHAWLASPASVSCRILTGPAGAGKTRLGIRLLEELSGSRWRAGFLREPAVANLTQRRWDQPTLAIVDYAASAAQALKTWLAQLADQSPTHPLRVLLLEREANPESGWLRELLDHTSTGHRIASLMDPPDPQRVTPLVDIQLRRQILEATLRKVGAKSELPPLGTDWFFDDRLAAPLWQDPLYLMMAVLVARLTGGLPEALSLTRPDLAFRLADRELDRIGKFLPAGAPPECAQLLTRLAAIVTACRSLERVDLIPIAVEESALLGIEFPGGPRVGADRVSDALGRQGKPEPIEPDIVGEAALLRSFGGKNLHEGIEALVRAARRADHRHAADVCLAITRTSQDFASDECQDPLDWVEEFIRTGQSDDTVLLAELQAQMPQETLVLRERAARVDQLLLAWFTKNPEIVPSEQIQSSCARLACSLSVRLSDLGRRDEALTHAEQAVRLHDQLAQQRPDAYMPDLAMSLNTLASRLRDVGRREEALAHAEEVVQLYSQLAHQHPNVYIPAVAMSLNNLSNMFSDFGRHKEALAHAEEAVRLYRELTQQRRDAFLPKLATSLDNLANRLSDLGHSEGALVQIEEAVRLRRQLAQQRPDAFLPDLAMSLNNLANILSELGHREEALAQVEEAVRLYRRLAQQHPDAFLPGLATSLNNLPPKLSELGRLKEALEQAEEAVCLWRKLAQQRPDAYQRDFALSLDHLAIALSNLDRREEALEWAEEAVCLWRKLAQQRPNAFLPNLARCIGARSITIAKDQPSEAMETLAEAIHLLAPLFVLSPAAHVVLMQRLCGLYHQAAQSASVDPDLTLLAPITAVFERLNSLDHP